MKAVEHREVRITNAELLTLSGTDLLKKLEEANFNFSYPISSRHDFNSIIYSQDIPAEKSK